MIPQPEISWGGGNVKLTHLPLTVTLFAAAALMVACGEDKDSRISDADAACLKLIQAGGNCGGQKNTVTKNVTVTQTVTQTNTTVVPAANNSTTGSTQAP